MKLRSKKQKLMKAEHGQQHMASKNNESFWTCKKCATQNSKNSLYCKDCGEYK